MATQKRLQQRNERIVQKRMAEDYVSLLIIIIKPKLSKLKIT